MEPPAASLTSPRHREMLAACAAALGGEGFETRLVPAAGAIPYDVLLVALPPATEGGEARQLELSFIPGLEEQIPGASLLQCFAALPGEVAEAAEPQLDRLLARLGTQLPLVGFGTWKERRLACFRHVLMLPDEPRTATHLVTHTVWLVSYLLDLFAEDVTDVAQGRLTAEEALARGPFAHLFR